MSFRSSVRTASKDFAPRADFLAIVEQIVGAAQLFTDADRTRPYRMGFRSGEGQALAVVRPRRLVEMWWVLQACVDHDVIVIMQAANTGLTGGSAPWGDDYDRDIVIISPMAIDAIHVLDGGKQVVCLPGATLFALEEALKPYGREPHSVIGSSCIGASVIGGVCNNSGGSLIQRGPAYTELALFARLSEDGVLRLVNHLGIALSGDPETILDAVEQGDFAHIDSAVGDGRASDTGYAERVRDIDAATPARFNADPDRLFEASGSAGKIAVFAVRLDSFPQQQAARTYYIGTNDPRELTQLRRDMLGRFKTLPVAAEYLHRDCFDYAATYGKDAFLSIRWLGTQHMTKLMRWQRLLNGFAAKLRLGQHLLDHILQGLSRLLPPHLPRKMRAYRHLYEHHLLLKVAGDAVAETDTYLAQYFPSASGDYFLCSDQEGEMAFLHRFVAAGAAIRYRDLNPTTVEDVLALDVALRRNDDHWFAAPPAQLAPSIAGHLSYGHFFCHVFHLDYVVKKGADVAAVKAQLLAHFEQRGAEYPAEHNVGHQYAAKPVLTDFYRTLDPCNQFNVGIGQTSKRARWGELAEPVVEKWSEQVSEK